MVLRRGPDHCRPTNIYVLDRVVARAVRFRDCRFKRIQIDDQQIDRTDVVGMHRIGVSIPAPEQSAVDLRVQGFDAPVHDFGKPGDLAYICDCDACGAQHGRRTAGRKNLNILINQRLGDLFDIGFVSYAD